MTKVKTMTAHALHGCAHKTAGRPGAGLTICMLLVTIVCAVVGFSARNKMQLNSAVLLFLVTTIFINGGNDVALFCILTIHEQISAVHD